ncbi:MAG: 50S ribosomal protein L4 [Solirubrobacterales bacterium]
MAEAAIKAPVLGKQSKADLPKAIFSEPFHEGLVHQAARADLNARRRGTHSSLTRGEVSMTGAKAWRQTGTGRARVGALGVPHRYGGGAAFGPKPRHYTFKVNRKARRRALRAALSVHAERGTVAVVDAGAYDKPATRTAAAALAKWGAGSPTLVVVSADEETVAKSFRNIPGVRVAVATSAGVADVIGAASLAVTEAALAELETRSTESAKSSKPAPKKKATAKKGPRAAPKSSGGASASPAKASQPADPGSASSAEGTAKSGSAEESAADGEADEPKGGE